MLLYFEKVAKIIEHWGYARRLRWPQAVGGFAPHILAATLLTTVEFSVPPSPSGVNTHSINLLLTTITKC